MSDINSKLASALQRHLADVSESICARMRGTLIMHDHVDTGALLASIRHEEETDGTKVTSYIYADAKNPQNGAMYAEFLELGTGAAHGRPGGRVGSWRYQDLSGHWHTTDGMDADPFIAPAVEANKDMIDALAGEIAEDIAKYWKLKGGTKPYD